MTALTPNLATSAAPVKTGNQQLRRQYDLVVQALIAAFGARLKTVVLFGSYARGEARPESDHDLLVVIDGLPLEPVARQRLVRHALLPVLDRLPDFVSLVAKTPQDVAANLTPLLLDVCVDGVCLYGASYFESYRLLGLTALRQSKLKRQRVGGALMWLAPSLTTNGELNWEGYFVATIHPPPST